MKSYKSSTKGQKIVLALLTVAISVGALELVVGGMKNPDPETMAVRRQVLAAQSERASQIRALENGQVKFAGAVPNSAR